MTALNSVLGSRSTKDGVIRQLTDAILSTPVFDRLRTLQRTYDPCDIEGLAQFIPGLEHVESVQDLQSLGVDLGRIEKQDWETVIGTPPILADYSSSSSPEHGALRKLAIAYLVSATFKDCSVMIHMPRQVFDDGAQRVEPRIAAIDLDLKPAEKLGRYFRLDRAIWTAYEEHLRENGSMECVDG
jgi:inositol-pentakisphosphate 2-kinase